MLRASTSIAKQFSLHVARRSTLPPRCFTGRTFTSLPISTTHPSLNGTATSRTQTLLTRHFSSSSTITDPSRPDLFYHLISLPTPASPTPTSAYAISFLNQPPPNPDSCSVIGWLPAETPGQGDVEAGLNDFIENPRFRAIMHEAIQKGLQDQVDDIWINGALQLQQGWMHIHDNRNVPALGRIGDPDDIIASVLVQDSKILPETYQPMLSYRVCTSDGPTLLTEGLADKLKSMLENAITREAVQ
ncbi:hypothetical protein AZE42_04073 [Rhizopogon vesiculosus]|uniref:Uncharacterized protein n=1 Tax=Rhizopogon vesiculosus TaxID=180088 RepID=A0A1J8PUV2_9AGAM|nr:hypothetical protein AZE42_04073 [Rhizopogon vesiculosus]